MNLWQLRSAIAVFAAVSVSACTATTDPPQPQTTGTVNAAIDANQWMVGEWTGTSQAGVPFTLTISPSHDVQYVFGNARLPMGKPTVSEQTVTIPFAVPGELIRISPTGANSGNWSYQGSRGFSRSTISRKT